MVVPEALREAAATPAMVGGTVSLLTVTTTGGEGDADGGGGGWVAGGVGGDRRERVRSDARGRGVPGDRVRRGGDLGAQAHAVELELHPRHADLVRGRGRDRDGAAQRGAGRRR